MAALYFYTCVILKLTLVAGQSVHYVLKGEAVVLSPDQFKSFPDDILWKHNRDKVVTFDSAEERVFPPYEGRVTLGWTTAQLTIADVRYEDSGEYELDAYIRDRLHRSQYMLKVLDKVSKPVIRCEVNDESGNSTSIRRATLLCSSESDTPETLTFKWNLEGNSHLGESLSINLGHEHEHMEYKCTATNPLQAETSVFMAKDCVAVNTERSSEALDIIVPVVIASLILLALCIFPFIFRHQIKRACLKQRKSNDLEKQITETDDKSKDEGSPLMGDIHRQETFASKQPLIQQKEYETPQRRENKKDLEKLNKEGKVKKVLDIFANREHTEPHSNTQTEEENEASISEMATSQPASPIRNGQVDSESDTESSHVPQSEEGNHSDSHPSSEYSDASEHSEPQSPSPGSDPQGLLSKTQEHEPDLHHFSHEAVPETHTADDSSSINTDQDQTTKGPEEKDSLPQSPHQSNVSISDQESQPEPVKSENKEQTDPDDKSTSAPKLNDPQTDVSQNETSEHEATGESELSDYSDPPESLALCPLETSSALVQGDKEESSPKTEPEHNAPQTDSDHESVSSDNNVQNAEDAAQTELQQRPPDSDLPGVESSQSDQNENQDSGDDKDPGSPPQPPHQSNMSVSDQDSQTETVKSESKEQTDPDDKSTSTPEPSDQQTDISQNNSVTSEHKATGGSELSDDSKASTLHSETPVDGADLQSSHNKNQDSGDKVQLEKLHKQDSSSEESEESKPTNNTEQTSTADTHQPDSGANAEDSTDEERSHDQESSVEKSKESKPTSPTEKTFTADPEVPGPVTESDEETDSSNSEQRHEAAKEGQQQS